MQNRQTWLIHYWISSSSSKLCRVLHKKLILFWRKTTIRFFCLSFIFGDKNCFALPIGKITFLKVRLFDDLRWYSGLNPIFLVRARIMQNFYWLSKCEVLWKIMHRIIKKVYRQNDFKITPGAVYKPRGQIFG